MKTVTYLQNLAMFTKRNGMRWAVGAGLIGGIEKDDIKDLAPQGNATRAQVAAILQRFCENVK